MKKIKYNTDSSELNLKECFCFKEYVQFKTTFPEAMEKSHSLTVEVLHECGAFMDVNTNTRSRKFIE